MSEHQAWCALTLLPSPNGSLQQAKY
jgi:hypothetical protein